MKRALVLSGGGSRGAYEIGVWRALRELDVRFQGVYGTSIGALNAALVAGGDLDRATVLWQTISISKVLTVQDEDDFAIDHMVSNKWDVIPFLVENARHLRMDITPLENMVRAECDEAAIRASGLELGVMSFRVPQMQAAPVRLRDLKRGELGDWIIASASCFPIFPARHIGGQRYIDGGYYDNQPIDMALQDGFGEVIAVGLRPEPAHPEYARMPWLTDIRPRHSLGGFLDFNPNLMSRSLRLGYQDAMKVYRRLDGWLYTFRRVDMLAVADAARRFMARVAAFDAEFMRRGALRLGHPVNAPLLGAIEAETEFAPLTWKDVWLRGVELCAGVLDLRVDAIYDAETVLRRARACCDAQPFAGTLDEAALHAAWKAGRRQTLALLTRWLDGHDAFPAAVLPRLGELPMETAAAMFLRAVKG